MKVINPMKLNQSAFSSAVQYPTALDISTEDHDEILAMTTCSSARTVLSDRRSLRLSSPSSLRLRDEFTLNDSWNLSMIDALESALAGGAR
jgi:hypothetical protein